MSKFYLSIHYSMWFNFSETDDYYAHNIRRSVREAALSSSSSNSELLQERSSDDGSEHFFIPLSTTDAASQKEIDYVPNWRNQQLVFSSPPEVQAPMNMTDLSCNANSQQSFIPDMLNKLNGLKENKNLARLFQPSTEKIQRMHPEVNDTLDQVFSPPLLLESSFFQDAYEDLLGMVNISRHVLVYFFKLPSVGVDFGLHCPLCWLSALLIVLVPDYYTANCGNLFLFFCSTII